MDLTVVADKLRQKIPGSVIEQAPAWLVINGREILNVAAFLKGSLLFESLHCITAVDRRDSLEVVYHFYSPGARCMLMLKAVLPANGPGIPSLTPLWSAADWLEREVFDLFGITFIGHPDLRRILNPETWNGHPLRKDFISPDMIAKPVK